MPNSTIKTIRIKRGKEKQLVRHHPWVFSGAVEYIERMPETCEQNAEDSMKSHTVRVEDSDHQFIAYGWYDEKSHIALRLLSWDEQVFPDSRWWKSMIIAAIRRRYDWFGQKGRATNMFRLVHGEADMLPGFAIDIYKHIVVIQISARVAWAVRQTAVEAVEQALRPQTIVVNVDSDLRRVEHLESSVEYYRKGNLVEQPEIVRQIDCMESGLLYRLNVQGSQKTGHYCDQRENRIKVAQFARNLKVLDLFCYTGGFTLNCLKSLCLSVESVDSSDYALGQLLENIRLNVQNGRLPADAANQVKLTKGDCFEVLRSIESDVYDMIIIDPPKLAPNRSHVEQAERAYKDVNRLAMLKVKKGGYIATFSCSGAINREKFTLILSWAAKDAKKEVHIVSVLGQPNDHPIRLSFPESEYLKGFILQVL